ncbi:hypothetical protein [Rivularia sp. UHCC 0363]|uniref:hypothetical protein n=1 Tax=Rivularia sp. UHCC 0363 TaxID=3110244 RepID=UPI002B21C9F5|nr:hypothetical protein [Rivularia sp. UHCC 0363]MEA5596132.1 hypothetical protein [Rivularia sp. UHCC 0363]
MGKRCNRNRNRSQKRAIYCPIHECYLDSVSQKHPLFADRAGQLQQRGMSRRSAMMLVQSKTAVSLAGEWLEAFWCEECQQTKWYYVKKVEERKYRVSVASQELWQQVDGVVSAGGNPSVSEFTRRQARGVGCVKDFGVIS